MSMSAQLSSVKLGSLTTHHIAIFFFVVKIVLQREPARTLEDDQSVCFRHSNHASPLLIFLVMCSKMMFSFLNCHPVP